MATAREVINTVPCDRCGSPVGEPCVTKKGVYSSIPHLPRVRIYESGGWKPAGTREPFDEVGSASYQKARRIDVVLTGIKIARRLGMSQDALDPRLDEMIVEAEVDL